MKMNRKTNGTAKKRDMMIRVFSCLLAVLFFS